MSKRYISHSHQPPGPEDWEAAQKTITHALCSNLEGVERYRRTLAGGGVYVGLSGAVTRKDDRSRR